MINRGNNPKDTRNDKYKNFPYKSKTKNSKNNNKNNKNSNSGLFGFLPKFNYNLSRQKNEFRGRNINPWRPFWQFITLEKKVEKKKNTWFQTLNFQNQNIGNKLSLE